MNMWFIPANISQRPYTLLWLAGLLGLGMRSGQCQAQSEPEYVKDGTLHDKFAKVQKNCID